MKIEIDETGGNNFVFMGADQFLSAGYNRFVKNLLQISGMDLKKYKQGRAKKVSVPV